VTLKSVGLVSVLASLAIVGYLFLVQSKEVGPTSQTAQQAQADATAGAAAASFRAAAPVLQAHFAQAGTYAGATVPPNYGVTLVRGDATSYCLQAGTGETARHVVGPAGSPSPGPC
jgi:uncharacterized membrane protein